MNSTTRVILVDDDPDLLTVQLQSLKIAGFQAEGFSAPQQALAVITPDFPGVILSDVMMPEIDGFEFFARVQAIDHDLPFILLTGHGDVEMAVRAMHAGVWDFLTKPVGLDQLGAALRRAAQARGLVLENRELREMRTQEGRLEGFIGNSPATLRLREAARRLGEAGMDVLITGPSGAGKETLARMIHECSSRRSRAFVHIACETLNQDRFEAEFLGSDEPRNRQTGRLEKAHRGTLFLDHIDAMPFDLQARLLHIIETRSYWSVGATAARPLDAQVIASSSVDLAEMVQEGRFNAELYYRLAGVTLQLPPLVERRGDIPLLFRAFLVEASNRYNLPLPEMTAATRARLESYDWPGNARELRQFAEAQALGLTEAETEAEAGVSDLATLMANYEASLLREALRATKGHVTRAMSQLNLPRKTFYDKLARHGIQPESFRERP